MSSLLKLLRRRIWQIVGVAAGVVTAVALATVFLWPASYRSVVVFLVEPVRGDENAGALAVLERLGAGNRLETEMELVRSRRVIGDVVDTLDLHVAVAAGGDPLEPAMVLPDFQAPKNASPGAWCLTGGDGGGVTIERRDSASVPQSARPGERVKLGDVSFLAPPTEPFPRICVEVANFEETVTSVRDGILVEKAPRDADLFRIECPGPSSDSAYQLCEAVSQRYLELRTQLQRAEATATADFLRDQVERVREQLTVAEDSLESYGRRTGVVALEQQAEAQVRTASEIKARRDELDAERSALAALMREIRAREGGDRRYRDLASFPTFLTNLAVTELVESLVELENRRSDLALRRSEANPDLASVTARIAEIERQLLSIAEGYERSLLAQIASLDEVLKQSSRRIRQIPTEQVTLTRLERRAELLDDLFRTLQARLQEAQVAQAVNLPSLGIVDPATRPPRPASPNLRLNLLLAVLFGSGLAVGVALFQESRDTRIYDGGAVGAELGLPVLSKVPELKSSEPVVAFKLAQGEGTDALERLPPSVQAPENRAIAYEAFHSLATDLGFAGFGPGKGYRSVVVTSATRGDGKTFTACNLALVRASVGVRTLLVDADLRAGGVSRFFGLDSHAAGLADLLENDAPAYLVRQTIAVSGGQQLSVIGAGRPTEHVSALLERRSFVNLLKRAEAEFELVIIDTPPLTLLTDAATIARLADGVLVVVRSGVTDREALEATLERLRRADGHVLGVVLNGTRVPRYYASRYYYNEEER